MLKKLEGRDCNRKKYGTCVKAVVRFQDTAVLKRVGYKVIKMCGALAYISWNFSSSTVNRLLDRVLQRYMYMYGPASPSMLMIRFP